MKIIKFIESSNVMAIDIETVRIKEHYHDLSEEWQSAWEYKNKQDGKIPDQDTLAKLWVDTSSLYPEFSKICAVSVAYLSKDQLKCKNYVSESEVALLKSLQKDLAAFQKAKSGFRLVGHASIFFDYPFMCKRYLINGMEIPDIFEESNKKPWEKLMLCTNELWRSFGTGSGSSLQALCTAFGVEVSKVDLVGDGVGKAYFAGELTRIADYCNLDTIATYNIFRKFKRESTFLFSEVVYVNQGEIIEPVPFLSNIQKSKLLTQEQAMAIDAFCSDLTVQEINTVRTLLEAALADKKGKLNKEHEEFLEKL